MDGSHSARSAPAAAAWRVPAYIAVPIVVACALLGYAISLMMPLRPAPADPALLRPSHHPRTGDLGTPAKNLNIGAGSTVSAEPSRDALKVAPAKAQTAAPPVVAPTQAASAGPALQQQPVESAAEPKVEPSAAKAEEVSRPERQARRVPRKARRVYWRPRPKPPAGPVEAFFSALTK